MYYGSSNSCDNNNSHGCIGTNHNTNKNNNGQQYSNNNSSSNHNSNLNNLGIMGCDGDNGKKTTTNDNLNYASSLYQTDLNALCAENSLFYPHHRSYVNSHSHSNSNSNSNSSSFDPEQNYFPFILTGSSGTVAPNTFQQHQQQQSSSTTTASSNNNNNLSGGGNIFSPVARTPMSAVSGLSCASFSPFMETSFGASTSINSIANGTSTSYPENNSRNSLFLSQNQQFPFTGTGNNSSSTIRPPPLLSSSSDLMLMNNEGMGYRASNGNRSSVSHSLASVSSSNATPINVNFSGGSSSLSSYNHQQQQQQQHQAKDQNLSYSQQIGSKANNNFKSSNPNNYPLSVTGFVGIGSSSSACNSNRSSPMPRHSLSAMFNTPSISSSPMPSGSTGNSIFVKLNCDNINNANDGNNNFVDSLQFDHDYCIDSVLLNDLDISDESSVHEEEIAKEGLNYSHAGVASAIESYTIDPCAKGLISGLQSNSLIALKAVMTTREAGLLIGKGGKTIGEIRSTSGAMIKILGYSNNQSPTSSSGELFSPTSTMFGERLLIVSGTIDKVSKAFHHIALCFKNPEIHLLVPHICMGSIIGRAGKRVRDLEAVSGARIAASTEVIDQSSCERCVSVIGNAESIRIAIYHISFALTKSSTYSHRIKESTAGIIPRLFPHQQQQESPNTTTTTTITPTQSPFEQDFGEYVISSDPNHYQQLHNQQSHQQYNKEGSIYQREEYLESNNNPDYNLTNPSGKGFLVKVVTWIFSHIPELIDNRKGICGAPPGLENLCDTDKGLKTRLLPLPPGVDAKSIFTFAFYLNNKVVGCVIGKNGSTIHNIRQSTECQIKINAMTMMAPTIGIYPSFLTEDHHFAKGNIDDSDLNHRRHSNTSSPFPSKINLGSSAENSSPILSSSSLSTALSASSASATLPKIFRCRRVIMTGTLHEIAMSLCCMREKIVEQQRLQDEPKIPSDECWIVPLAQTNIGKRSMAD